MKIRKILSLANSQRNAHWKKWSGTIVYQRGRSCVDIGVGNWALVLLERICAGSTFLEEKLQYLLIYMFYLWPSDTPVGIYIHEMIRQMFFKIDGQRFTAASFIILKRWKQPKIYTHSCTIYNLAQVNLETITICINWKHFGNRIAGLTPDLLDQNLYFVSSWGHLYEH